MLLNIHYIVSLEKRIKQISFQIIPQINLMFFLLFCFVFNKMCLFLQKPTDK